MPAEPGGAVETLIVGLPDSIDRDHAPAPTNESERLLFRHLSRTLVRIDCRGEVRPEIARKWTSDSTGRIWTFTMAGSGGQDRPPVITAPIVASAWLAAKPSVEALGIDSVVALDDSSLRVVLGATRDSAPRLFAEPVLALRDSIAAGLGGSGSLVVPGRPQVEFQLAPGSDPRDALDRDVDLIVTRDPAITEYVSARPEFATFPLPWSRTYVLLQPADAESITGIGEMQSVMRSLASDIVRVEARPAEPPFWWEGEQACRVGASAAGLAAKSPRILYSRSDEVARDIAERIVALASGSRLRAVGVGDHEFAAALREQSDLGYVVALPRQVPAPCYRSRSLPPGARIQPLVDTRAVAIVRRGGPPLSVEWGGSIGVDSR